MAALIPGGPAAAQLAVSVALESDYQYHGLSLSDGRPTVGLTLAYDHPSGLYAGASVIGVDTAHDSARLLGYVAYAGYAARLTPDLAWEVGASETHATDFGHYRYAVDYAEVYAGLSGSHVSARLYYSPDYLSEDRRALYADLDGHVAPAPGWRLTAHVGALAPLEASPWYGGRRALYDARIGVARQFTRCELRLAWTGATGETYAGPFRREASAVSAGASLFF